MNAWFADAMRKLKFANGHEIDKAITLSKGTGLYPRDVQMMAMTGGLFAIPTESGAVLQHKRVGLYEVSFQGAYTEFATPQTLPGSPISSIVWPLPLINTIGAFDPGQPTRFTIPDGVNIVRLSTGLSIPGGLSFRMFLAIRKNGTTSVAQIDYNGSDNRSAAVVSGPIPVVTGDYFEVLYFCNKSTTYQPGPTCHFALEVLDASFPVSV